MQTQFWKNLQEEIYFVSVGKLSEVIITSFSLVLISHFLLTWGWSFSIFPAIFVIVVNGISLMSLYQYKDECGLMFSHGHFEQQDLNGNNFPSKP